MEDNTMDQVKTETSEEEHTYGDGLPQTSPEESKQLDTEEPSKIPNDIQEVVREEQTPTPGEESKTSGNKEHSRTQEDVEDSPKNQDKIETSPEEQTTVHDQIQPQMEENKPSQTPVDVGDSLEDEAQTVPEEQTTVDEQTPPPGEENKSSGIEEPSQTIENAEDSRKDQVEIAPEEHTAESEQTLCPGEEDKPSEKEQPLKTLENVKDSEQVKPETTPEDLSTVDDQTLSQMEGLRPSDKEETFEITEETGDLQKDKTETEPEVQTTEDEQVSSQEEEENKPSVREETLEVVGDSAKDQAETATEEQTSVDEQTPSQGEENKPSYTEEQAKTPKIEEVPEKDKTETAPEEQTTVNERTPSSEEENQPSDKEEAAKSPEDESDSPKGRNLVVTAVVGVLFAIILRSFFENMLEVDTPDKPSDRCDPHKGDCRQFLSQSIHKLSEKYKDQESNSWRTLHAAAFSHVSQQSKPVRPIVILVYWVNSSNHQILFDISNVYSSVLSGSKSDGNIVIQGTEFVDQESESVQKHIAGELERGFEDGKKVAIIHDFDNLPSCSVLTFHNYCNNEDAPYTDVAIILTMTGNPKMEPGQKPKVLEESVSTIFHKKWSDCPEDLPPGKIDAILSRVANNVVLLR